MEDRRFDDLTKALAAPTTRRQALKRLGAGLAGALAGAFGLGRAELYRSAGGNYMVSPDHLLSSGSVWRQHLGERL